MIFHKKTTALPLAGRLFFMGKRAVPAENGKNEKKQAPGSGLLFYRKARDGINRRNRAAGSASAAIPAPACCRIPERGGSIRI